MGCVCSPRPWCAPHAQRRIPADPLDLGLCRRSQALCISRRAIHRYRAEGVAGRSVTLTAGVYLRPAWRRTSFHHRVPAAVCERSRAARGRACVPRAEQRSTWAAESRPKPTVSTAAEFGAAIRAVDLTGALSAPNTAYSITLAADILLTTDVTTINLAGGDTLSIIRNRHTLDAMGRSPGRRRSSCRSPM